MSYYDDEYPRRGRLLSLVIISIVSAVIGGLLALSVAPMVYGPDYFNLPGQQGNLPQNGQKNQQGALPPASLDYSPVVAIAERVGPTIVGISNQAMSRSIFGNRGLIEQGSGSGVIISQDGYIVTNYHVIENAQKIMVNVADGRQFEAEVKGSDPETDLAVLKINASNLPAADLGDSDKIRVGELVVAIGNPLGYEFARSVTAGVISAKDREITIQERKFKLIQTDAAINPGNSGGALVNSQGEVIGINSAKLVITGVEGMGFAIPVNTAKPIINELIEKGYVSRPYLGIWGAAIDERTAQANNLPQGIYIQELVAGGPAQKAGMRVQDIIVGINGQKIVSFDELNKMLKGLKPGDTVTVNIYRGERALNLTVVLGDKGKS